MDDQAHAVYLAITKQVRDQLDHLYRQIKDLTAERDALRGMMALVPDEYRVRAIDQARGV